MNAIALYLASGESLYPGALLLLLLISSWNRFRKPWPTRLRNLLLWIALALMAMACPPVPVPLVAAFALALTAWLALPHRFLRSHAAAAIALAALTVLLPILEFPWRTLRSVSVPPDRPLTIIGDSISAGIDPHTPTWPEVLHSSTHRPIRNLARAGAQVDDALDQARHLTPDDRLILIEIGGNDLLSTTSAEEFRASLDALLARIAAPDRQLLMFELPLLPHKISFGYTQRQLARKYHITLIPKRCFIALLSSADATSDGLHLSPTGTRRLAALIDQILVPSD